MHANNAQTKGILDIVGLASTFVMNTNSTLTVVALSGNSWIKVARHWLGQIPVAT